MADTSQVNMRYPNILLARIDSAAGNEGRTKWILEACRMRLNGGFSSPVELRAENADAAGSIPAPSTKPDKQALRDICAGEICKEIAATVALADDDYGSQVEVVICGKTWWEEGVQYECLMDKFHKNPKHGQHGMVQRLEE